MLEYVVRAVRNETWKDAERPGVKVQTEAQVEMAKMVLCHYIDEYKITLAPNRWADILDITVVGRYLMFETSFQSQQRVSGLQWQASI